MGRKQDKFNDIRPLVYRLALTTCCGRKNLGFGPKNTGYEHACVDRRSGETLPMFAAEAGRAVAPNLFRHPAGHALIDEAVENPAVVFGQQHAAPEREVDAAVVDRRRGGQASAARTADDGRLRNGAVGCRKDRHDGDGDEGVNNVSHGFLASDSSNGIADAIFGLRDNAFLDIRSWNSRRRTDGASNISSTGCGAR